MFQRCNREFVILYFLYIRSEKETSFMGQGAAKSRKYQ